MLPYAPALIAFVTTVEAGSFSAAARSLDTTPSAISKAVARLERRFGMRLFQRSTRVLSLTQEGAAYYERIAPLLRALDDASDVLHPSATAQGVLRVSAPGDLGRLLMEPIVRHFLPAHPALKLEMSLVDRHVDLLREGYDIALRAGNIGASELTVRELARLPLVLVAAPVYLERHGVPRTIQDLREHAHIRYTLDGKPYPITFENGTELTPPGVLDADSGAALRIAAVAGLGITQILRLAVQNDIDDGSLHVLLPDVPLPRVPVSVLHAFGRQSPARARLFVDFLAQALKKLA
ncbi:LysR family transcriptional regulator [Bordetella sp. LUAb4]|uniref:LysR family transcriptional regulator n=1 Tax=Bordetella sp. LUAb4 TaxID=2843195 RepID=UPI001E5FBBB5|nr:LysR family transcriptional regulator [Bordetella sp. LUAb4]